MKKNNSFKRAALPVIATLLAAIISLTGVTFAWFSAGTTATVDQITIGVNEADGLQIATSTIDGFAWGSQFEVGETLQNRTFAPMSGAINADNKLNLYTATLDDNYDKIYAFKAVGEEEAVNYITFDLYFRNVSTSAKNVNINGSAVTAATGDSHRAARIAFLKKASVTGSAASYTTDNFVDGNFVSADAAKAAIYEPNSKDHSASGMADYVKYNGGEGNGKYSYMAIVADDNSGAYYNRYTGANFVKDTEERTDGVYTKPGVNTDASLAGGNLETATGKYCLASNSETEWTADADYIKISAENALNQIANRAIYTKSSEGAYELVANGAAIVAGTDYYVCDPVQVFIKEASSTAMQTVTTMGDTTDDVYFELAPNTVTKVTVVIWLEGQDADCNNATAGRPFNVALQFNAVTKAGSTDSTT